MITFEAANVQSKTGVTSMHSYLKSRPVWIQLMLFVGMAFGIFLVVSLIATLVLSRITGIGLTELAGSDGFDLSKPGMLFFLRGLLLAQFLGLFLIPVLLFAYFSDPQPLAYLGLRKPGKEMYFLVAAALMFVALPFVEALGLLNQQVRFPSGVEGWMKSAEERAADQIEFMLRAHSLSNLLLNLIFISLFAAVGEEFFFRGILQRLLIRAFRAPWPGIIATAFIFSAIHLQFYGFLPRFVLGIILGTIYWYSGSLWTAILAHFVYDGFIIFMVYNNPALAREETASIFGGSSLIIPALISLAMTIALVWWMQKQSTTTYAGVYAGDRLPPPDELTN